MRWPYRVGTVEDAVVAEDWVAYFKGHLWEHLVINAVIAASYIGDYDKKASSNYQWSGAT